MTIPEGFRAGRWRDRYFGVCAFLAGVTAFDAAIRHEPRLASYWAIAAITAVLLTRRPLFVVAVLFGFIALQSLFSVVAKGDPAGLFIVLPALALALLSLLVSQKRGEELPKPDGNIDLIQFSIDIPVYFLIFLIMIKLT